MILFIQKGKALKDVVSFERTPGGAPANVAAAVAKYGQPAVMITKVGEDGFGQFLLEELAKAGIETDKIVRTNEANTGLAFVSLQEGFLYKMLEKQANPPNFLSTLDKHHKEILAYANASGALTTTGKGSINSIPTRKEISDFLKK